MTNANRESAWGRAGRGAGGRSSYERLEEEWCRLRERYLPLAHARSIWRFSRESDPSDAEQGWKLHIPATVLTAGRVLEAVGPALGRLGVLFKAPATLFELNKINSGLHYGYSQVGKFITVYPRTEEEAVRLARRLHRLTRGFPAPDVPFDMRFRPDSCVHYRYGSFKILEIENPDGTRTLAMRGENGELVPDRRDSESAGPPWVSDPFAPKRPKSGGGAAALTPLKTRFRVFAALAQRGKGGVYKAVDIGSSPPRLCVVKEGRRHGEVWWDGRDGHSRVRHEWRVLSELRAAGVSVPRPYKSFRAGKNFYVAVEYVEGMDFNDWLTRRRRRLPVARALRYGLRLAELISKIHAAGWVWRDCKPRNLILTPGGELRPLDFEGACRVNRPDPSPWSTRSYAPPECTREFKGESRLPEDLYALGAVLYLLLSGVVPGAEARFPLERLRRNVPAYACELVEELLCEDPARRPAASEVGRRLAAALSPRASGGGLKGSSRCGARGHGSAGLSGGRRRTARSSET
ncbi:MAG TPA: lipopolysaccharide kinase InaA family protein [Pyrinomonadaceae bacterium]